MKYLWFVQPLAFAAMALALVLVLAFFCGSFWLFKFLGFEISEEHRPQPIFLALQIARTSRREWEERLSSKENCSPDDDDDDEEGPGWEIRSRRLS